MTKTPKERAIKILQLWENDENEWKQYHKLRDEIQQTFPKLESKRSERTIMRYLQFLVKMNELEKKIKKDHSTWYKPKPGAITKQQIKEAIDKTPLQTRRIITTQELKEIQKINPILEKFLGWNQTSTKPRTYTEPSFHSAILNSEKVKDWKPKLVKDFQDYLQKQYPTMNKRNLKFESENLARLFLHFLEINLRLSIFSDLQSPQLGNSVFRPDLYGKEEKDFYADFWDQIFDNLMGLLIKSYSTYDSLEDFLEASCGSNMLIVVEANTDFSLVVEYLSQFMNPDLTYEEVKKIPLFWKWTQERQKQRKMSERA